MAIARGFSLGRACYIKVGQLNKKPKAVLIVVVAAAAAATVNDVISRCMYRIDVYFCFSGLDSGRISAGQQSSVSPSAYIDYTRSISSIGGTF